MDLSDSDVLKEILRRRLVYGGMVEPLSFDEIWSLIAVGSVNLEPSFEFLIRRSLMRPRVLLDLIGACKTYAVNRRHVRMEEDDVLDGVKTVSTDLVEDISADNSRRCSRHQRCGIPFAQCRSQFLQREI